MHEHDDPAQRYYDRKHTPRRSGHPVPSRLDNGQTAMQLLMDSRKLLYLATVVEQDLIIAWPGCDQHIVMADNVERDVLVGIGQDDLGRVIGVDGRKCRLDAEDVSV